MAFWLSAQITIHRLVFMADKRDAYAQSQNCHGKKSFKQLLKGKLCAQLAYRHIGHAYRHTDEQTNLYRTFGA